MDQQFMNFFFHSLEQMEANQSFDVIEAFNSLSINRQIKILFDNEFHHNVFQIHYESFQITKFLRLVKINSQIQKKCLLSMIFQLAQCRIISPWRAENCLTIIEQQIPLNEKNQDIQQSNQKIKQEFDEQQIFDQKYSVSKQEDHSKVNENIDNNKIAFHERILLANLLKQHEKNQNIYIKVTVTSKTDKNNQETCFMKIKDESKKSQLVFIRKVLSAQIYENYENQIEAQSEYIISNFQVSHYQGQLEIKILKDTKIELIYKPPPQFTLERIVGATDYEELSCIVMILNIKELDQKERKLLVASGSTNSYEQFITNNLIIWPEFSDYQFKKYEIYYFSNICYKQLQGEFCLSSRNKTKIWANFEELDLRLQICWRDILNKKELWIQQYEQKQIENKFDQLVIEQIKVKIEDGLEKGNFLTNDVDSSVNNFQCLIIVKNIFIDFQNERKCLIGLDEFGNKIQILFHKEFFSEKLIQHEIILMQNIKRKNQFFQFESESKIIRDLTIFDNKQESIKKLKNLLRNQQEEQQLILTQINLRKNIKEISNLKLEDLLKQGNIIQCKGYLVGIQMTEIIYSYLDQIETVIEKEKYCFVLQMRIADDTGNLDGILSESILHKIIGIRNNNLFQVEKIDNTNKERILKQLIEQFVYKEMIFEFQIIGVNQIKLKIIDIAKINYKFENEMILKEILSG